MVSRRERREECNAQKRRLYIQAFPASATAAAAARAAHKASQRLRCIREIWLYWKGQRVIKSFAEAALLLELVLVVLQKLMEMNTPIANLEPTGPLTSLRKRLLGDSPSSATPSSHSELWLFGDRGVTNKDHFFFPQTFFLRTPSTRNLNPYHITIPSDVSPSQPPDLGR
jgi:hypothetical protein